MSGHSSTGRSVNVVPYARLKKEVLDDIEDTVACKVCTKGYANQMALNNHVRVEHIEVYANGDPSVWTRHIEPSSPKNKDSLYFDHIREKTEEVISEMKPTNMMSLASNDVSYIIIKSDDFTPNPRRRGKHSREERTKSKDPSPITGPFECLQPSVTVENGTCHQIFFSCCDYSVHYRDEHTRRRKGLRCQVCEKPLVATGNEPQAPYNCDVCGEGFSSSRGLSEHSTTAHMKLKPYQCKVCHKRFTQMGGVMQHMRMHTGDRPFPCTFCSKAFTQKSGLDQHLRIHTKVRPYRCVVCSKCFSQSIHLKQHMRTHTQVSPFQCGFCDKRFKQSSHLNYHLKTHNPANMSESQKAKYSELIGLIAKEYVEVGMDQSETEGPEQEQSEIDIEDVQDIEIEQENEQEIDEERVIVEGQEVWISVDVVE